MSEVKKTLINLDNYNDETDRLHKLNHDELEKYKRFRNRTNKIANLSFVILVPSLLLVWYTKSEVNTLFWSGVFLSFVPMICRIVFLKMRDIKLTKIEKLSSIIDARILWTRTQVDNIKNLTNESEKQSGDSVS